MSAAIVVPVAASPLLALEAAYVALAEAVTVADVKTVRDKAEALRAYARQSHAGLALQNECAELKLRAERKAGEILSADPSIGPGKPDTLSGLGIAHAQSSRWQRIAAIPEPEFDALIADAFRAERELTTAAALKLAKRLHPARKPRLALVHEPNVYNAVALADVPDGAFATVVADPPWRYDNRGTRAAAEDHYDTMTIAELCALPVAAKAADAAHLYLWTTNPFLREAFDVLAAWGFTYKTCLTWTKPQIGMGNYFRSSTEHVLFGIRGGLGTKVADIGTWFKADRTRHSAKPDVFYDLVERASEGPYLEMFARRRRLGDWSVWGDEA